MRGVMSNLPYYMYWLVLLLALACVAVAIQAGYGSEMIFWIYAVPIWIWAMYLNFRKGRELMAYLKQHHKEKWEHFTNHTKFGTEGGSSFKLLPFVYSGDYLNDPMVSQLKEDCKDMVLFVMVVFVSIPLVLFYVFLL